MTALHKYLTLSIDPKTETILRVFYKLQLLTPEFILKHTLLSRRAILKSRNAPQKLRLIAAKPSFIQLNNNKIVVAILF